MPDRNDVIDWLETALHDHEDLAVAWVSTDALRAALALLKEPETVTPKKALYDGKKGWQCSGCGWKLFPPGEYCAFCGRKVKWDEAD